MTHTQRATEGDVLSAIVEAGKAIYLSEESTAKTIAQGSKQQVNISQNFVQSAEQAVTSAISAFNAYEAQVQAASHASFWGSLFSWALVIVSVVASAFAGPEMLVFTVALLVASKTGLLDKAQTALGDAVGSKLLAGILLTAVLVAAGAGAGGAAGAVEEDAGSVVAKETADAVETAGSQGAEDASNSATQATKSVGSKIKAAGKAVTRKIGSLSRTTAGGLNGLGQGLQNFNIGSEVDQAMAKLKAKWATDLGISLDVLINVLAVVSEGAGTGNGMMRATAAGKGLCGSSMMVNNANLFKAVGVTGMTAATGEGSCGIATGVLEGKEGSAIQRNIEARGESELLDAVKEISHDGFTAWISSNEAVEKSLAKQANDVGNSISAVNTQLAIAMSGRG